MTFSVKVIRETFNKTRPISDQVTKKFYDTLFEQHPEAMPLFHNTDSEKQQQLLYNSLDFIVTNLENPERLSEYLQNLGGRHVDYGTEEEHFDWVGGALLHTFAYFFGDEWTEEVQNNWAAAFGTIRDYMLIGMRANVNNVVAMNSSVEANAQEENTNEPEAPEPVTAELNNFVLPDNVKEDIRNAVRSAIESAIQAEVQAALELELKEMANPEKISDIVQKLRGAA